MSDDQPISGSIPVPMRTAAHSSDRATSATSAHVPACGNTRPRLRNGETCCLRPLHRERRAGQLLGDKHFSLHDIEMSGAEPSLKMEVLQRTPGVACYNPFEWPVLDTKPLAFVGYGEDQNLLDIAAVRSAIEAAFGEIGRKFDGPTSYALVFKEIDGERYRAVVDFD